MRMRSRRQKYGFWARACLKNHSRNLHAPLCGIFCPNSVAVARYDALIRAKSPTNCDAHLAESLFQTRSSAYLENVFLQFMILLCWSFVRICLQQTEIKIIWKKILKKSRKKEGKQGGQCAASPCFMRVSGIFIFFSKKHEKI